MHLMILSMLMADGHRMQQADDFLTSCPRLGTETKAEGNNKEEELLTLHTGKQ